MGESNFFPAYSWGGGGGFFFCLSILPTPSTPPAINNERSLKCVNLILDPI